MNVSIYLQTAYENIFNWTLGQNKPNSNPISSKAKMSLKSLAGKSGHTRKNLDLGLRLIFPTITLECLAEKQRFLTK